MIITNKIFISNILKGFVKNLIIITVISASVYFLNEYLLKDYFDPPEIIPAILGTALAFFIDLIIIRLMTVGGRLEKYGARW